MKMKKSTWLLLVLALAAILLVAGCEPTTPTPTPPENGEEPPPTPPGDTAAPKVVKTMVSNAATATFPDRFKITIVFDEDIYSPCAEDWDNWTVRVVNSQRIDDSERTGNATILGMWRLDNPQIIGNQIVMYMLAQEQGAPVITYKLVPFASPDDDYTDLEDAIAAADALIKKVDGLSENEFVFFLFRVGDGDIAAGQAAWNAFLAAIDTAEAMPTTTPVEIAAALAAYNAAFNTFGFTVEEEVGDPPTFFGLICNQDDADAYEEEFGKEVTAADIVTWELDDDCAISDVLGNSQCGYSGEACCVGPECEECVECDLTTGICK